MPPCLTLFQAHQSQSSAKPTQASTIERPAVWWCLVSSPVPPLPPKCTFQPRSLLQVVQPAASLQLQANRQPHLPHSAALLVHVHVHAQSCYTFPLHSHPHDGWRKFMHARPTPTPTRAYTSAHIAMRHACILLYKQQRQRRPTRPPSQALARTSTELQKPASQPQATAMEYNNSSSPPELAG